MMASAEYSVHDAKHRARLRPRQGSVAQHIKYAMPLPARRGCLHQARKLEALVRHRRQDHTSVRWAPAPERD